MSGSALGDTLIGNAVYVDGQLNFIRSGGDTAVFYENVTDVVYGASLVEADFIFG